MANELVGESGLGKTTFLNSLWNSSLTEAGKPQSLFSSKTVEITPMQFGLALVFNSIELVEKGVTLQLSLIDTPGFGDQLNREQNFEPIIGYIDSKHEQYFNAERKEKRAGIPDNRVHCLLYFLPPTGLNRVNDLDLEFLQRICTKVNVIPVIGKSDSLLPEECARFKKVVSGVFYCRFYGNLRIMTFVLIQRFTQKIGNLFRIWNNTSHLLLSAVIVW